MGGSNPEKKIKIFDLKTPYLWANWWALLLTRLVKLLTKLVFLDAHETSFHETSFFGLLTKRALTTRFSASDGGLIFYWIELKTKNSTKRQQSCRLVEFLVFNSAFGRHSNWLIPSKLSSMDHCDVEVITLWCDSPRRLLMVKWSKCDNRNIKITNWW